MDYRSNKVTFRRVPIAELRPYGRVLHRHPKSHLIKVRKSLSHYGQAVAIPVSPKYEIIDGHVVVEALKANGETEVLVGIVNDLTPAQIRGLRLMLNRSALDAGWDHQLLRLEFEQLLDLSFDLELTGFPAHEVELTLNFEIPPTNRSKRERSHSPEERPIARPGDIFQLGGHRIGCGDGRDRVFVDRVLAGAKPAACFLEPCSVGESGGEVSEANLFELFRDSLDVLKQVSSADAVMFAFTDGRQILEMTAAARQLELQLLDVCVWGRTGAGDGSLFRDQLQLVPVFARHRPPQPESSNQRSNLWKYAAASNRGRSSTSPIKPVALFSDAIRDVTKRADAVLGGSCGSESLIIAAEKTGRRCCAIDSDPRDVDLAIRSWQKLTGRDAVPEQTNQRFDDCTVLASLPPRELGHDR